MKEAIGKRSGLSAAARNQAEQELEQADHEWQRTFDSIGDLVSIQDVNCRLVRVNKAYADTFKKKPEELVGRACYTLVHRTERPIIACPHQETLRTRKPSTVEMYEPTLGIYLEVSTSPLFDDEGNITGTVHIARDITEREQMVQQLKQQMDDLQSANHTLKELDQLKDNFLSTVSHELRTPLTSIKSFTEILLDCEEDRTTQKEFLSIINEESDRLTRLINDLLDLSKIEAGCMKCQTTRLAMPDIVEIAANAAQGLFTRKGLRVNVRLEPDLPPVWGDRDRLVQVLTNLLSNAIKFTPDGGEIEIAAHRLKSSDGAGTADTIRVSVSDSGAGIRTEDQNRLFHKFQQAGDMPAGRPEGTGLGLAICKEIVEQCGGRIWLESAVGKGSTFFFTLPVAKKIEPEAHEAKQSKAVIHDPAGKTILVVDDEANIRRFLTHELTHRGHRVIEAASGKEAIDLARKHHPDLITLDVLMPDIMGLDVAAVLKGNPDTKDIPILILSILEEKEKAYQVGADSYVTKPFNIETLMNEVALLLTQNKKKILVADDDRALVKAVRFELEKRGYSVSAAYNGEEALRAIESNRPDLVVLDLAMPKLV